MTIYYDCLYIRYAYKGAGAYCMLQSQHFGNCDKCPLYESSKSRL
jgi:hypothetical protein